MRSGSSSPDSTRPAMGVPCDSCSSRACGETEVLGLQWSGIDMGRGIVIFPPEAEKTGRTREELGRVALSRQAVELLAAQRSALFAEGIRSEFVFATTTGERPHSDSLKPILYGLRGRRSN